MGCDSIIEIIGLITAIVGLITAVISLIYALIARRKSKDANEEMQRLKKRLRPLCIQGPTYVPGSPGHVKLRVKLQDMNEWWFVAVSENSPDSVWVQRMGQPDTEGNLELEAWGFKGKYAVYGACDDTTIARFQELQARAAQQKPANLHDLPKGKTQICEGETGD